MRWINGALNLLAAVAISAVQTEPRSIDTLIAERRAVLTSSLHSGGWVQMADMVNASLVGASRARALRIRPFTATDMRTINFDGGPHFSGHDLVAVLGDLIGHYGRGGALQYMEIGVAQGRNVYGALQVLGSEWSATAFSFERINPPLENKLRIMAGGQSHVEVLKDWQTSNRTLFTNLLREVAERHGAFLRSNGRVAKAHPKGLKEEDPIQNPGFFPYAATRYGSLRTVNGATKSFTYIHADEYDANAWSTLAEIRARDGPWQMVLSDAEHTEAVVQYECDRYESSKAIDFTRFFALLWDDEMMSTYCTKLLQRLSPKPLTFASIKVMGRTGTHVWQLAASLPLKATHFLASQMIAQRVAHYLVHPNGKESTCCATLKGNSDPATEPPKRPPTAA